MAHDELLRQSLDRLKLQDSGFHFHDINFPAQCFPDQTSRLQIGGSAVGSSQRLPPSPGLTTRSSLGRTDHPFNRNASFQVNPQCYCQIDT
jgi:hypothetical protein